MIGVTDGARVGIEKRGAERSKSSDSRSRFFSEIIYCSFGNPWRRLFNILKGTDAYLV